MKVYKTNDAFFMEDANKVVELTPNADYYLKLPANTCNRVWVSCAKVDKAPGQCIDYGAEAKVARVLGPREGNAERKPLEDYLDEKDRKTYLALIEKAKAARAAANKKQPMSELEKAQRAVEKWQARVELLSK